MPRFRFALQRVLDLRLREEEARRLALAGVEGQRRMLEDSLRTRQVEISAGRDEWRRQLVGEIDPDTEPNDVASVSARSLAAEHGRDESMNQTMRCIEETVTDLLRRFTDGN